MKSSDLYITILTAVVLSMSACSKSPEPAATEPAPAASEPAPATPDLASRLAASDRSAEDKARDATRKPAEVIEFLGIEPGMTVIDIIAAGGWYTEVLSHAVGPEGKVYAQNPAVILQMRDGVNDKALTARIDGRLGNVERLDVEVAEIAAHGPFDAAITALNMHDIYNNFGEEGAVGALTVIYNSLKPGAVFGVIDHDGVPENDNKALHRIPKADVIRVAEAAGFVVDGESDILRNDIDDMSLGVFDESVRGKTNRFLLRLRKPTS